MMDYEFIASHKAVAIGWDNEAELKEAKEARNMILVLTSKQ